MMLEMNREYTKFAVPPHMINIAPLCATIELSLWAGYVENARPVSIMIIGDPELGGTEVLKSYSTNQGVRLISSMTPYGIFHDYGEGIWSGEIKHLFLTDVSAMMGTGQQYCVRRNLGFLNGLIEEGLFKMSIFWGRFVKQGTPDKPVRCAVTSKITRGAYRDRRTLWRKIGLVSRMLPFSADYMPSDVRRIKRFIMERKAREGFLLLELPPLHKAFNVEIPEEFYDGISNIASDIIHSAEKYYKKDKDKAGYGFRATDILKSLVKASCLRRNYFHGLSANLVVNKSDVHLVSELSYWWNYDFNRLSDL